MKAHRLEIEAMGKPVGKGRGRPVMRNGHAAMVMPSGTRDWQATAAGIAMVRAVSQGWASGYKGPVEVRIKAVFPRPLKLMGKKYPGGRMYRPSGRPDADNVGKCVCDALQDGGVIHNDGQVACLSVLMLYAAKDAGPSVEITMLAIRDVAIV